MPILRTRSSGESRSKNWPFRKKTAGAAMGIALAALVMTGCTTDAAPVGSGAAATNTPEVIRLANDVIVTTLDPIVNASYQSVQITFLWGGHLTSYGEGDEAGQPLLAESVTASDNLTDWSVTLKEDIVFSDGSPITADDVVASFERLHTREGIANDSFVGPFFTNLQSITAADEQTIDFTFANPLPNFAKQVAMPQMVILPAAGLAEGDAFWEKPISAGRYTIESADLVNGSMSFTANPEYIEGEQEVKNIEMTAVPEAATRLAQLRSGQIDYAENLPGNLVPQITGDLRVDEAPWAGGSLYLFPNVEEGSILSDVRIRQAINLAIDREQVSETALGGEAAGKPLYGVPWNQTNEEPNVAPYGPDIDGAKELLAGTECENGCTISFGYLTDAVWQLPLTAQVVAEQLAPLGITVELESRTTAQPGGWGADTDLWMGWTGFYDDSANYLSDFYITAGWMEGTTGFSSEEMSALGRAMATADSEALPALTEQANELFLDNVPMIPVTTLTYLAGSSLPEETLTNTLAAYFLIP